MSRRLPPLNALKAFEAAARHLSFTKAADELAVTQAAISHQVKGLEEFINVELFLRRNRNLELTAEGRAYLPILSQALDLIHEGTQRIQAQEEDNHLRVSVLHSFATKWLLPRLPKFRARYPNIDVLISARDEITDLYKDDIEVSLRFGSGDYSGLDVEYLMGDKKYPVCSPSLLVGEHPLKSPEDLQHHSLIHDVHLTRAEGMDWAEWLKHAGVEGINAYRGTGYSDSSMEVAAAIAGQGVALTRHTIAGDDVAAGVLVQPFGPEVTTRFSYYFVTRPDTTQLDKVRKFRDWLFEEARLSQLDQKGLPKKRQAPLASSAGEEDAKT